MCGVANIQKSSINAKVKLLKAKVLYLTAYGEDDMIMMITIIIIIMIFITIQICCSNDFTEKCWTVVDPKLSGTHTHTHTHKYIYIICFVWFIILPINHVTTVLTPTNTQ